MRMLVSGRRAGVGLFMAGAVLAGLTSWAIGAIARPAEHSLHTPAYALVTVADGQVGSTIQLNSLARWTTTPLGVNRANGIVTSVDVTPGMEVAQGSILYSVGLRPVVVAIGAVPAFRDVVEGASGQDVLQVQQLLTDLGFYNGEVGGEAGRMTVSAIRHWQKSLGVEQTGVVAAGDIIFVPSLPVHVSLDEKVVYRGATLMGGEQALLGLPPNPDFSIPVTDTQSSMILPGTRVEITSPNGEVWNAVTSEQKRDATTGDVTVALAGAGGSAICGDQCGEVPVTGHSVLSSRVVIVETVQGLVVPSSALISTAEGSLAVIDEAGKRMPVVVVAAARGQSVITGIDAGSKVRVPGKVSK